MAGPFGTFLAAYPVGSVGLAQFVIGVLGCVWAPVVAYRAWRSSQPHLSELRRLPTALSTAAVTSPPPAAAPAAAATVDIRPSATREAVILPCYIPVLCVACFLQVLQMVLNLVIPITLVANNYLYSTINAVGWSLQRFTLEGLAFFLAHHGAGWKAYRNSLVYSTIFFVVTLAVFIPGFAFATSWGAYLTSTWNFCVGAVYAVYWLAPSHWVYRRPALLPFAAYMTVLRFLMGVGFLLQQEGVDFGNLLVFLGRTVIFNLLTQPIVYHAMVMDSMFWQGCHPVKQSWYAQLIAPLDGIRFTMTSAAGLVHRLDELTSKSQVNQLDFAHLKLDTSKLLGVGGQARVYKGQYRTHPVAIKVLLCLELTPDIIDDFCNEARLLTDLAHPNIVRTYGVCVVPPTVSIVMELCERGSLFDVLHSNDTVALSWHTKLRMCRDCANSLAFLHSRGAVHRDIKSSNFLVAAELTVKLADLGVSQENLAAPVSSNTDPDSALDQVQHLNSKTQATLVPETTASVEFRGTVIWAAPEALCGKPYTPAADVYSFALVGWEVLSGLLPFDRPMSQQELIDAVCGQGDWLSSVPASERQSLVQAGGLRPPMPTNTPTAFATLLTSAWSSVPARRPSAQAIVAALDAMLSSLPADTGVAHFPTWAADVSPTHTSASSNRDSFIKPATITLTTQRNPLLVATQ